MGKSILLADQISGSLFGLKCTAIRGSWLLRSYRRWSNTLCAAGKTFEVIFINARCLISLLKLFVQCPTRPIPGHRSRAASCLSRKNSLYNVMGCLGLDDCAVHMFVTLKYHSFRHTHHKAGLSDAKYFAVVFFNREQHKTSFLWTG